MQKEGETLRQVVFEDGVIPKGKHSTRLFFIEAVGMVIN